MQSITNAARFNKIISPPIQEITQLAQELEKKGKSIIHSTGQGAPFIFPPKYAIDAFSKHLGQNCYLHNYTHDFGLMEVREAVSSYLIDEFSIKASPDNTILTVGANMAFYMLLNSLITPNETDEVILVRPYYFNHLMAIQMSGAKPVIVESNRSDFNLDPDGIKSAITDKTKAIVLVSPNNPSGAVFPRNSLEKLEEIFENRDDILLISDEPYSHFVYGDNQHFSPAALKSLSHNTATIGSASKTFGIPGWRLGWLNLPINLAEMFQTILKIQDTTNIAPPTPSQLLVLEILKGPYHDYLIDTQQKLELNWQIVCKWMNSVENFDISFPQLPQGAFYLFFKLNQIKNSQSFVKEFLFKEGVVTIPGSAFGEEQHVRFSYGGKKEDVEEALTRLERYLKQ